VRGTENTERTCIVTRRRGSLDALIRFVCSPEGVVAPDIRSRLPGRGVWVTARAELVAEAARKQIFARQLKASVKAEPELADEVDRLLEADCLQSLSMANKAGLVVTGYNKVAGGLEKDEVAVLLQARDGAEDGKRKIAQAARRGGSGVETVSLFTSSQMDLALGRTNVIHAALKNGGPTVAFLARCRRLAAYRGGDSLAAGRMETDEAPVSGGASPAMGVERTGVDPESDI
jgi:predicted RNA-binding protein YlxR (DUF448 family)